MSVLTMLNPKASQLLSAGTATGTTLGSADVLHAMADAKLSQLDQLLVLCVLLRQNQLIAEISRALALQLIAELSAAGNIAKTNVVVINQTALAIVRELMYPWDTLPMSARDRTRLIGLYQRSTLDRTGILSAYDKIFNACVYSINNALTDIGTALYKSS